MAIGMSNNEPPGCVKAVGIIVGVGVMGAIAVYYLGGITLMIKYIQEDPVKGVLLRVEEGW